MIDLLRLSFDQVQDLDRGKEAVLCRKYSSWERSTEAEKGRGGRARRRRIPYGRERTSLTTGSKTSRLRRLPGIVTSPFTSPTAGSSGSSTLKHVKWNILSAPFPLVYDRRRGRISTAATWRRQVGRMALTIVFGAGVPQLLRLAKMFHEVREADRVEMYRVVREERSH